MNKKIGKTKDDEDEEFLEEDFEDEDIMTEEEEEKTKDRLRDLGYM